MAQDDVEPVVDGHAPGLAAELLGQQRERVEPARVALVAAAQLLDLALQLGQRAAGDALALALEADHGDERARVGLGGQPEQRRARDLARRRRPRPGCSASVGPPAVAKSCCSASTQGES